MFYASIGSSVALGHTDRCRIAEDVVLPLFKLVYSFTDLKNLNHTDSQDYPGIDLGDDVARVAIQVTATADASKVKSSIETFVKYRHFETYDRLLVYVLREKQKRYSTKKLAAATQGRFTFDPAHDVLDYRDLMKRIDALDLRIIRKIEAHLNANFVAQPNRDALRIASDVRILVRDATAKVAASWLVERRCTEDWAISLRADELQPASKEAGSTYDLARIAELVLSGNSVVLESPGGYGKTTMLAQLASLLLGSDKIPVLVDLPSLARAKSLRRFLTTSSQYSSIGRANSESILSGGNIILLLNGWNEVPERDCAWVSRMLLDLARNASDICIVISSRSHLVQPPLYHAKTLQLQPADAAQRSEYIARRVSGGRKRLVDRINQDVALDEISRVPFFLASVVDLFEAGEEIPNTRTGLLGAMIRLTEKSVEHAAILNDNPLRGTATEYLVGIATAMTNGGGTLLGEKEALQVVTSTSANLKKLHRITGNTLPRSILTLLSAHHILVCEQHPHRQYRFQHQRFQEYYAALALMEKVEELDRNPDEQRYRSFVATYLNSHLWSESVEMVVEELGRGADRKLADPVASASRIVLSSSALSPVFAASLARAAGAQVWDRVRAELARKFRQMWDSDNGNLKQYGLAALLTSGAPDFADIVIPLVESDEPNVRLGCTRTPTKFYITSLGEDWKAVVGAWGSERQLEFVNEMQYYGAGRSVLDYFASVGPDVRVRAEAIACLASRGDEDRVVELLKGASSDLFERSVSRMQPDIIPRELRGIPLDRFLSIWNASGLERLRLAVQTFDWIDHDDAVQRIKDALEGLDAQSTASSVVYYFGAAARLLGDDHAGWLSAWVADRIASISLAGAQWADFVVSLPPDFGQRIMAAVFEGRLRGPTEAMQALYAKFDDTELANDTIRRLFDADSYFPEQDALYKFLPTFRLDLAVDCLISKYAGGEATIAAKRKLIDIVVRAYSRPAVLRQSASRPIRLRLRELLVSTLESVMAAPDADGHLGADLAVAIACCCEPQDIDNVRTLIEADIERMKKRKSLHSVTNRYCEAIALVREVDPRAAEDLLIELLSVAEYRGDSAKTLVRIANVADGRSPMAYREPAYLQIMARRCSKADARFNRSLATRFGREIRGAIDVFLAKRAVSPNRGQYDSIIHNLLDPLAVLDAHNSVGFVLNTLIDVDRTDVARTGYFYLRLEVIEHLFQAGAILPTQMVIDILDPLILGTNPRYFDQNYYFLQRCLCVLPFVDDPRRGIQHVEAVLFEHKIAMREVIVALGYSRCTAAVDLLLRLRRDGFDLKGVGAEWLRALATLGMPAADEEILSVLEPSEDIGASWESFNVAEVVAGLAARRDDIRDRIFSMCRNGLTKGHRDCLVATLEKIGSLEAGIASLGLVDDADSPPVPYRVEQLIRSICNTEIPTSGGGYWLAPQQANELRKQLFRLVREDPTRRNSAISLLAMIDVWRLEYGKPRDETWHPDIDSGLSWPPISLGNTARSDIISIE